jgi:hypothetical protein
LRHPERKPRERIKPHSGVFRAETIPFFIATFLSFSTQSNTVFYYVILNDSEGPHRRSAVFSAKSDTVFHSQLSTYAQFLNLFHSYLLCSFCLDTKRTKKIKSKRNSLTAQTTL